MHSKVKHISLHMLSVGSPVTEQLMILILYGQVELLKELVKSNFVILICREQSAELKHLSTVST